MAEREEVGACVYAFMTLSARVLHEHVSGVYCEGVCVRYMCMYVFCGGVYMHVCCMKVYVHVCVLGGYMCACVCAVRVSASGHLVALGVFPFPKSGNACGFV